RDGVEEENLVVAVGVAGAAGGQITVGNKRHAGTGGIDGRRQIESCGAPGDLDEVKLRLRRRDANDPDHAGPEGPNPEPPRHTRTPAYASHRSLPRGTCATPWHFRSLARYLSRFRSRSDRV